MCRSYENQSAPVEVPHLYLSRNRWKLNMSCIYTWKHLVSTECGEKLFDEHLEEAFSHSPKAERRRKKNISSEGLSWGATTDSFQGSPDTCLQQLSNSDVSLYRMYIT